MLVVRPNKRRMQRFRDSPSENALAGGRGSPFVSRPRLVPVFLGAGIAIVIVLGLIALYVRF